MAGEAQQSRLARFGPYELNLQTGELRKSGLRVRLQEQPFQVLRALLQDPGELVTREDLHQRLWPDATHGDFEQGLNKAVNKVRTALSDRADNPRYIETLARRGYRFLGPVQWEPPVSPAASPVDEPAPAPPAEVPIPPQPALPLPTETEPVPFTAVSPRPQNPITHLLARVAFLALLVFGALLLAFTVIAILDEFEDISVVFPSQLSGEEAAGVAVRWDVLQSRIVPLSPPISADNIRYSPDGEWMVFVSYPSSQLYMMRADGSDLRELTPGTFASTYTPDWSPTGDRLAFAGRKPESPWKVYIINRDGSGLEELNPGPGTEADPTWSADGNSIALAPFPWDTNVNGTGIYIVDLATRAIRLLPASRGKFSPRWSPDGTMIAALTAESSELNLYRFDSNSWTELTGGGSSHPVWDSTSTAIYFVQFGNPRYIQRYLLNVQRVENVLSLEGISTLSNSPFGPRADAWVGLTPRNEPIFLRSRSGVPISQ